MAEVVAVLGLIASILGILDGIDKSTAIIKKYVHKSSSLRADLVPVLGKLAAFAGILRGLQLECELYESDNGRLQTFVHIREPLQASEKATRTIMTRLDQVISIGGISISFGKVLNQETSTALHILDQTKSVLELALTADQRTLLISIEKYVRNVAEDLRDIHEESKIHYLDLKDDLSSMKSDSADTAKAKVKADVLTWVSQINYSSNFHAALLPTREEDKSGDWFIEGPQFNDWIRMSSRRGLVLTGISGAGKTVLCSKAIRNLARNKTITDSDANIIYFFFDFSDVAKQSVEGMIRSLAFQLMVKIPEVPEAVRMLYPIHKSASYVAALPSLQDWCGILISLLGRTRNSFIFIDALDECAEAEANLLQETLEKLVKETGLQVKWFLTCRPSQRSTSILQNIAFVHRAMDTWLIDNDIERYLMTKLTKDPGLTSFGSLARELTVSQIRSKSSGMFRFAQCQLNTLSKLRDRRVKKVREVLDAMPEDLYTTYSRILNDLQRLDDWPLVDRILAFVSYSARPVTVAEVAEFAILEDSMTHVQPEERFEDFTEILSTVSSLVNVQDGNLSLAHKSVQDFLVTQQESGDFVYPQNSHLLYEGADIYIARRCFQYLAFQQKPICEIVEARNVRNPNTRQLVKMLNDYPLLDYAASRWPHHVRTKKLQAETAKQMQTTIPLGLGPNLWKAWLMLQRADIWDAQLKLARLLCEASVRSALIPGWANNFWTVRQNYRVRTDAKKLRPIAQDQFLSAGLPTVTRLHHSSIETWDEALKDNGASPTTQSRASGFGELGIVLLEVALQRSLNTELEQLSTTADPQNDLVEVHTRLVALSDQAAKIMGQQYGAVILACLSTVKLVKESKTRYLFDQQEHAMEKLHLPLQSMQKSGFRASKSPVGGVRGQMSRAKVKTSNFTPGSFRPLPHSNPMPVLLDESYSESYIQAMSSIPLRGLSQPLSRDRMPVLVNESYGESYIQAMSSIPQRGLSQPLSRDYIPVLLNGSNSEPYTHAVNSTLGAYPRLPVPPHVQKLAHHSSIPSQEGSRYEPPVKIFDLSTLSTEQFKQCSEPWALSSIVAWIKYLAKDKVDLREQAIAEALVTLFTRKVPSLNNADAEILGRRVVKEMLAVEVLVKDEAWITFGPGTMNGVLFQLTGNGCYSSKGHEWHLKGRCYSYHCRARKGR